MLQPKDLHKQFKTAAWASMAEVEAFVTDAEQVPAVEMLKLLELILVKGPVDTQLLRNRCIAFAMLAEKNPSEELFVPYLRALRQADPQVRAVLAPLVPKVNSIPGHPELCHSLRTPDADLRKIIAGILKQVAGRTAFDLLSQMVAEPDFPGRLEAADVLVGKGGHHAIPALQSMLQVGKSIEKAQALKYLGDARLMAKDLPTALKAIASALEDTDERVVVYAIVAFGALCTEDDYFRHIAPALDSPAVNVVRAAVEGLKRYESARAIAALERKFRQGPNAIRMVVLDVLEAIGKDEILPPLVAAMHHKQVGIRNRAAEILTKLAMAGKLDLARAMLWLLRSRDVNVRRIAVEVVRKVGDPSGELAPKLLRFLRDEDWWVRERVTDALVEMAGSQLTRYIVQYLQDPSDIVRRYAVEVLLRVKDPAALGALVRTATTDEDWWVRERAIEAIGVLKDQRALPYIVDILGREPDLVFACFTALAELEARAAGPHVATFLGDESPDVRYAALECLAAIDDQSQTDAVEPLTEDENHRVRRLAREIAARWNVALRGATEIVADKRLPLLDRLLVGVARAEADDLLLYAGAKPYVKKLGSMTPLANNVFSHEQVEAMLMPHLSASQKQDLESLRDVDFSYEVKTEGLRFRANVFRQLSGISAVFRIIKGTMIELEKLGLPSVIKTFGDLKNGLVLVGGPTGSGKSTTLGAMVDYINRSSHRHIITLEDPVEVVHERKNCLINQREVGTHTASFASALRATLREDPDVILCGEMRDLETIAFAVTAAETGHLVFGTVHTVSADTSVDRLINAFPPGQHPQVRSMLAETLRAVVCQHLLRRVDQPGRQLAVEIMINSDAVSNLIRTGKTYQLPQAIQTSRELGMQSMDSELLRLLREGRIGEDEAYMKAADKAAFDRMRQEDLASANAAANPTAAVANPAVAAAAGARPPAPPTTPSAGARPPASRTS